MPDAPATLAMPTAVAASNGPLLRRADIIIVAVCVIAALSFRLWLIPNFDVISSDGTGYATTAQRLARGDFSLVYRFGFYPVLIALAHLVVPDIELAGRLVSAIMGSLLILPVYGLGVTFFNRSVALCASLLVISWPEMIGLSCEVMTQTTYLFLVASGILLSWRSFGSNSRQGALGAGVVLGLAYMTRTEAVILPLALLAAPLLRQFFTGCNHAQTVKLLAGYALGFLLIAIPNILLIHEATATWQLAFKTSGALRDGLMYYLKLPNYKLPPELDQVGYWEIIRHYPDYFAYTLQKNLTASWQQMLPVPLWLLTALGFMAGGWHREQTLARLYLATTFAPYLVIVVFFYVDAGYFLPYLPILFLWLGQGLAVGDRWLQRINIGPPLSRILAHAPPSVIIVALVMGSQLVRQIPQPATAAQNPTDSIDGRIVQKELGLMVKRSLPPGKLMTRWVRTAFYADRDTAGIPERGSIQEVLTEARQNKVRFLLVEPMTVDNRPQLATLFEPAQALLSMDPPNEPQVKYLAQYNIQPYPGFYLYLLYRDQKRVTAAIYEIRPEGP